MNGFRLLIYVHIFTANLIIVRIDEQKKRHSSLRHYVQIGCGALLRQGHRYGYTSPFLSRTKILGTITIHPNMSSWADD
jgi:hypothetical protein